MKPVAPQRRLIKNEPEPADWTVTTGNWSGGACRRTRMPGRSWPRSTRGWSGPSSGARRVTTMWLRIWHRKRSCGCFAGCHTSTSAPNCQRGSTRSPIASPSTIDARRGVARRTRTKRLCASTTSLQWTQPGTRGNQKRAGSHRRRSAWAAAGQIPAAAGVCGNRGARLRDHRADAEGQAGDSEDARVPSRHLLKERVDAVLALKGGREAHAD